MTETASILHATCVAVGGRGALIIGPSGSGKSALALGLIALGAQLVSDDRTQTERRGNVVFASPPQTIAGMIEARGVGIIRLSYLKQAPVALVIDLARSELERMPQPHTATVMDIELPCLHKVDAPHFSAAIHAYLMGMREDTP